MVTKSINYVYHAIVHAELITGPVFTAFLLSEKAVNTGPRYKLCKSRDNQNIYMDLENQ